MSLKISSELFSYKDEVIPGTSDIAVLGTEGQVRSPEGRNRETGKTCTRLKGAGLMADTATSWRTQWDGPKKKQNKKKDIDIYDK